MVRLALSTLARHTRDRRDDIPPMMGSFVMALLLTACSAPGPTPVPRAEEKSLANITLGQLRNLWSTRQQDDEVVPVKRGARRPGSLPEESLHPERMTSCDESRRIVVHKAARKLDLRCGVDLVARYDVGLGFAPEGDKEREGDGRTPEGEYFITNKYVSKYHRSLQLSYPNAADADRGLAVGQIDERQHASIRRAHASCKLPPQTTDLGSWLQIHGGGGTNDWTLGCVAMADDAIEAAYAFHLPGCRRGVPRTRVVIRP